MVSTKWSTSSPLRQVMSSLSPRPTQKSSRRMGDQGACYSQCEKTSTGTSGESWWQRVGALMWPGTIYRKTRRARDGTTVLRGRSGGGGNPIFEESGHDGATGALSRGGGGLGPYPLR